MTTEYLGVKQVAERLGITQGALLSLNLPEPDALTGRTRGWLPSTIDRWNVTRPGRGVGGGRPRKKPVD
ncbi:helix-turn-helix transcriptional regulator [Bifidobacterium catenulatum]|uniref:helix-turn-helix transcriptional regulator n=1 Tax=Bifidobacterium catenulatum TaxID=1686 RepID=UPI003D34558C